MDAHDDAQKGVDVLELFAGQGERDVVEPRAAVSLGNGQSENAELAHLVEHFGVELALGVPLAGCMARPRAAANSRTMSRT